MIKDKIIEAPLAYIVGDLGNGGQERQLLYLLRQLQPVKNNVTVIVWDYKEEDYHAAAYRSLGFDLVKMNSGMSLISKLLLLRKTITTHKPLILHSYTFYLNLFCWLSCLGLQTIPVGGIRSRLTLHMAEVGNFLGFWSVMFPKYRVSNNEYYAMGFSNRLLKSRLRNTFVITNHLDLDTFKEHIPADDGVIRTASVGRFTEEKRISVIVDIVKELRDRDINIIHSHAGKGPLMADVRNKIEQNKLTGNFILAGEIDDVDAFLSDKHFFVHAAHTEGYPNVIMEAMACAKPVVTTDCGDVRGMVSEGENGFIHDVDDVQGMIASCERLAKDQETRYSFSLKSRSIAEEKFSLDHLLQQTINTYSQLCAE